MSDYSYDWAIEQEPDRGSDPRESCQRCGEWLTPEQTADDCAHCLEQACQICGEWEAVARFCPMKEDFTGYICDRCEPDEPGDSFYEGR